MSPERKSAAMKAIGWPDWLPRKFGDYVCKKKGSCWHGRIVGWYTTEYTNIGYAVESHYEPGSVQIYPHDALTDWSPSP